MSESKVISTRYALITAACNEEDFIEKTITSVISQTVQPIIWFIVINATTDRTLEIANTYSRKHNWIKAIELTHLSTRHFENKANAINHAYKLLSDYNFDFLITLDADVSFENDYFEFLIDKLDQNENMGLAGTPFVENGFHSFYDSHVDINHVHGACQCFRRQCFDQIGGYKPSQMGAEDWLATRTAQMHGWETKSFTEKTLFHHRKMGTASDNIYKARYRMGQRDGFCRNHPLWEILRCLFQLTKKPYFVGGFLIMLGYIIGLFQTQNVIPAEVIRTHQKRQLTRLMSMLKHLLNKFHINRRTNSPYEQRIAMIAYSLFPQDPRVRRQIEVLNKNGIAVDLFCLRNGKELRNERQYGIGIHRIMKNRNKETLIRYCVLTVSFTFLALIFLEIKNIRRNYRLVQVHNMPDYLVFSAFFRKLLGTPVLFDIHDLTVELCSSKWGKNKTSPFVHSVKFVEKISCSIANHVITTSPHFCDKLKKRGLAPDKITVIINAPNKEVFSFDDKRSFVPIRSKAKLIYHGTVAERFGLLQAVDILKLVNNEIPGSTLNIYGKYDREFKIRLKSHIEKQNMEKNIFLHDWKTAFEIRNLIEQHDISIIPHLKSEFMNLAILTKVLEYASSGIPMVMSDLKAITLLFGEKNQSFAEPYNTTMFSQKIIELCLNPDTQEANRNHAFKTIEPLNRDANRKYYGLVSNLLSFHNHKAIPDCSDQGFD